MDNRNKNSKKMESTRLRSEKKALDGCLFVGNSVYICMDNSFEN